MTPLPIFISVKVVAQQLGGAHPNTIWNWTKRLEGFPQPVKIGGRVFWYSEHVQEYARRIAGGPRGGPELHAAE